MYNQENIILVISIVVVVIIIRTFVSIIEDNKKEVEEELKKDFDRKHNEILEIYKTHELEVNAKYLKLASNVLEVKPYYENTSSINSKVKENNTLMTSLKKLMDECKINIEELQEEIKKKEEEALDKRLGFDQEEPPFIS